MDVQDHTVPVMSTEKANKAWLVVHLINLNVLFLYKINLAHKVMSRSFFSNGTHLQAPFGSLLFLYLRQEGKTDGTEHLHVDISTSYNTNQRQRCKYLIHSACLTLLLTLELSLQF